ncbi:MAG: LUD domain-containing protein [Coriobacteriales bacterium]|jgi:L-lactate dehydrogenase complex protein LldG|nr:LUD domain-containing protein [Coriobacteriales bacterium]
MTSEAQRAKDAVVARVRTALRDVLDKDPATDVPQYWAYGQPTPVLDPLETFIDRLKDYRAHVKRTTEEAEVPALVLACLTDAQATSCCMPPGLDSGWLAEAPSHGIRTYIDDPPLATADLDRISAVVTCCAVCAAETGTIMLDHRPDQGRRLLTLLPDTHVCVVRDDQVLTDVPEALKRLSPSLKEGRPATWVSGPSATSDIELARVEGVHGPRNLYVIVVG